MAEQGNAPNGSWQNRLKKLGYPALFFIGLAIGLYGSDRLYHPGCTLQLSTSGLETSCASPYEVPLNFGQNPSSRSLSDALSIVQDRTRGTGQARIYIDQDVLNAGFAKMTVHPPSGSQSSLAVVRQLLDEAQASKMVDICLELAGGFRVKLNCANSLDSSR
jgi:hypothetical protein